MGLQNFEILKIFYRGKKVLELPVTCKFTKIFFGHSRKKLKRKKKYFSGTLFSSPTLHGGKSPSHMEIHVVDRLIGRHI
jgi:hypothetical protein